MDKWQFINYFDVWGNTEEGWEVNNLCKEWQTELPHDAEAKHYFDDMINNGFLKPAVQIDQLSFDYLGDDIVEISVSETYEPLGRYELVYKEV